MRPSCEHELSACYEFELPACYEFELPVGADLSRTTADLSALIRYHSKPGSQARGQVIRRGGDRLPARGRLEEQDSGDFA